MCHYTKFSQMWRPLQASNMACVVPSDTVLALARLNLSVTQVDCAILSHNKFTLGHKCKITFLLQSKSINSMSIVSIICSIQKPFMMATNPKHSNKINLIFFTGLSQNVFTHSQSRNLEFTAVPTFRSIFFPRTFQTFRKCCYKLVKKVFSRLFFLSESTPGFESQSCCKHFHTVSTAESPELG